MFAPKLQFHLRGHTQVCRGCSGSAAAAAGDNDAVISGGSSPSPSSLIPSSSLLPSFRSRRRRRSRMDCWFLCGGRGGCIYTCFPRKSPWYVRAWRAPERARSDFSCVDTVWGLRKHFPRQVFIHLLRRIILSFACHMH